MAAQDGNNAIVASVALSLPINLILFAFRLVGCFRVFVLDLLAPGYNATEKYKNLAPPFPQGRKEIKRWR